MNQSVSCLPISNRLKNRLMAHNMTTTQDILYAIHTSDYVSRTGIPSKIGRIENMGPKSWHELKRLMTNMGYDVYKWN